MKNKCYELNNTFLYKRKNIDFNDYGFNILFEFAKDDKYTLKTSTNCVKKIIKR